MMEKELDIAIDLRKSGSHKESNELLMKLVQGFPDVASINDQCAWSFDLYERNRKQSPFTKMQSN